MSLHHTLKSHLKPFFCPRVWTSVLIDFHSSSPTKFSSRAGGAHRNQPIARGYFRLGRLHVHGFRRMQLPFTDNRWWWFESISKKPAWPSPLSPMTLRYYPCESNWWIWSIHYGIKFILLFGSNAWPVLSLAGHTILIVYKVSTFYILRVSSTTK